MLEGVVELYGKVSAGVVLCGTFLVLAGRFFDREYFGTGGGDDVMIFCTGHRRMSTAPGARMERGPGGGMGPGEREGGGAGYRPTVIG